MGSGNLATHYLTAWGQWAVQPLQYTAPLPGGMGSGTPAMHGLTAMHRLIVWGQWAVDVLQCTTSLPEGRGPWNSRNHCLIALG